MKRALALLGGVLLLVAGCGGGGGKSTSSTGAQGGKKLKVGLTTDIGGLNDRGFNHLAYVGLLKAARDLGIKTRVVQSATPSQYIPNLGALARQGYNLVIGVGFTEIAAMKAVAKSFPKTD